MYRHWNAVWRSICAISAPNLQLELPKIVIEQPPKVEFGEYALPLAFELAKKLRKAPRKIAEEIVAGIGAIRGL